MKKRLSDIIIAILAMVFMFASVNMGYELTKSRQEKEVNSELARLMELSIEEEKNLASPEVTENFEPQDNGEESPEPSEPVESPEPTASPEPEMLPRFESLYQLNQDIAGWLHIDNTEIDYPVMYTPEDQNYYLHRAFDGSEAFSGMLFIGVDWEPNYNHTIIYGHNMKDGSMFASLANYSDENYTKEHSIIQFNTLYEEREYEVIASFYSENYVETGKEGFEYYDYTNLTNKGRFYEYLAQVKAESLYFYGDEVEYGDRLLTLSTCSYHTDEGRFIVVAVQK